MGARLCRKITACGREGSSADPILRYETISIVSRGGSSGNLGDEGGVGRARSGGLVASELSALTGLFEFAIAVIVDGFGESVEHVMRGDVADGRVQPNGVVMLDEGGHALPGFIERSGAGGADAFAFQAAVPAFGGRKGVRSLCFSQIANQWREV